MIITAGELGDASTLWQHCHMRLSCTGQVALVQRLYDVQGGQVLVDGIDVRQLQVKWLRSHIGVVSQEPVSATSPPCSILIPKPATGCPIAVQPAA
jgi:hypothetical protein